MQDAKFSRGKKELLAFGSLVFVGNIDVQGNMPHEKYYHLFEPLPDFLQVIAFLDRIHAYLPGWELPKLNPESYARDYGFITDYFCEILHELRRIDVLSGIRDRFEIIDTAHTAQGLSGRDQRAILKSVSGLLKLLYPDGTVTDDELEEVLLLASELRQRVREQLHLIAPGEYDHGQAWCLVTPFWQKACTRIARCRAYPNSKVTAPAIYWRSYWPRSCW